MRIYIITVLLALSHVAFASSTHINDAIPFIELLNKHYKQTSSIKAFSLTHSYLGRSEPYQSWDFEAPSRYKAFKVTDIDLEKQYYYQNVVHHYTGGLYFDEVHFQNGEESVRYERNGISLGKRAIEQNMNSFTRFKNLTFMNLDFFAVRPLLQETDINGKVDYQLDKESGRVTLTHQYSDNKVMEYVFNTAPLQLESINNRARKRIYLYSDYQTSNGFHFAHSLIKHYNGDSIPSFITLIEKFDVIEQIEPEKLTIPNTYQKTLPKRNLTLASTKISQDLYLVTDASAKTNTLFKVNGDNIMIFGAPSNSNLSKATLEIINKKFPNKSIHGVFVTHPYSEHIAGLLPYVEQGIKIYADIYTIKAIKAYPRFAKKIEKFTFETISHEQAIDGVHFYVLENSRSKRQSFAYFKQSGTIYQSDFLEVAHDNTIANILPSYSKLFIDFVRNKQLKINRIVGQNRNNNISLEVVNKSYRANTM
ncbi:hypothetical protein RI844_18315 [Thalassotalea fonticola]|uniref:MBL fold metallo-hydrolase n=1 Tax=Thalassotalea fonticola TaxID=3065649 RepID=A0ABZ0GMZ0_9GAMM|nr:hypothetical protein RI844_18315 [Colwelliaceae bacterium S1-1]